MDNTLQSLMKDIDMVSQELSSLTKEQRRNYTLDKERKILVNKRVRNAINSLTFILVLLRRYNVASELIYLYKLL